MDAVPALHASHRGFKSSCHIEWINPITDSRWQEFITCNTSSGVFHHPAWLNLLGRYSHKEVQAVCLLRNNTILTGMPLLVDSASGQMRQAFVDHFFCGSSKRNV